MDFKDLGHKIRKARLSAGLTQAEVAERAGRAESTVGHIETAQRHASLDVIDAVVRAMGARLVVDIEPAETAARTSAVKADHRAILERLSTLLDRLPSHRIDTLLEDIALWETKYPPDQNE
jgi:transcriptional regulator with XRE-family HTH domain